MNDIDTLVQEISTLGCDNRQNNMYLLSPKLGDNIYIRMI